MFCVLFHQIIKVLQTFACMEAPLKIYALLASVSCTQLLTSWVGNGLLTYVKVSNSHIQIHPHLNILTLPNWLAV